MRGAIVQVETDDGGVELFVAQEADRGARRGSRTDHAAAGAFQHAGQAGGHGAIVLRHQDAASLKGAADGLKTGRAHAKLRNDSMPISLWLICGTAEAEVIGKITYCGTGNY